MDKSLNRQSTISFADDMSRNGSVNPDYPSNLTNRHSNLLQEFKEQQPVDLSNKGTNQTSAEQKNLNMYDNIRASSLLNSSDEIPDHDSQFEHENQIGTSDRRNSAGTSVASSVRTNFFDKKYHQFKDFCQRIYITYYYCSISSLLIVPIIVMCAWCGVCMATLLLCANASLDTIYYENALLMVIFTFTEVAIKIGDWSLKQISKYQAAWKLVFSSIEGDQLFNFGKGAYGKFGRVIFFVLMLFRLNTIAITFLADWESLVSLVGTFDCILPLYDSDSFGNFTVSPGFISGDIDFAEIYMYGLPLADGMIAGLGPWPLYNPPNMYTFSIRGEGPLFVMRIDCDLQLDPWYGVNQLDYGSSAEVSSMFVSQNSFNANINMLMPSVGFDGLETATPWVSQNCRLDGVIGKSLWEFQYTVDEWQMITGGQALQLTLGSYNIIRYQTLNLYADMFMDEIRNQNANLDNATLTNYALITQFLANAVYGSLNDVWYGPSQGGTFSNFLSWATQPNGYYYPNLTARGLTAGIGAAMHQVFMQYDGSDVSSCPYWGTSGAGRLQLNPYLVYLSLGLLSATILMYLLHGLTTWLLYKTVGKNVSLFNQAAQIVVNEDRRLFYMSEWVNRISYSGKKDSDCMEMVDESKVRFGETKKTASDKIGILAIAPTFETVKIRQNRMYFNSSTNFKISNDLKKLQKESDTE